tara:strand:+ start:3399 stop:3503 length:105 start_codon:yes stop_codon:yes gene_type:complete
MFTMGKQWRAGAASAVLAVLCFALDFAEIDRGIF